MKKMKTLFFLASALILSSCARFQKPTTSSVDSASQEVTSQGSVVDSSNSISSVSTNNSVSSIVSSASSSSSIVKTLLDQNDWQDDEKDLLMDFFELDSFDVSFLTCYVYEMYMLEDDPFTVYVDFETEEEEFEKYLDVLDSTLTLSEKYIDEYGDYCYIYEIAEDVFYYISGYYYSDDEYYVDAEFYYDIIIPSINPFEMFEGFTIDGTSNSLDLSPTYPKATKTYTYSGITFETSGNVSKAQSNPFAKHKAIQFKKPSNGVYEYLCNKTALKDEFNEVFVSVFSTLDAPAAPSIYASNSVITDKSKATKVDPVLVGAESVGDVNDENYDGLAAYYYAYEFDSSFTYFALENSSGYAMYIEKVMFAYIEDDPIGDDDGGDDIIDTGDGYKLVSTENVMIKNITDVSEYVNGMKTVGEVKSLIIPIDFSDYDAATLNYSVANIEAVFNGESTDSYTSVKEYFYESSYHKLSIDFDVYPEWVRAPKTFAEYDDDSKNCRYPLDVFGQVGEDSYATVEQEILNYAIGYLSDNGFDLSQYDIDNDNYIDSVVLIYSGAINAVDDDAIGWAWMSTNFLADPANEGNLYVHDNLAVGKYLWASYDFMHYDIPANASVGNYTFIHEFSHVLGADDYYNYEYDDFQPTHTFDMMDCTLSDHTAYTKMIFGWANDIKLITTKSTLTIELDSFQTSGDVILVANNWDDDKGIFQEYWTLEYYTNKGLNSTSYCGLFNTSGLMVHHVYSPVVYSEEYDEYYIGADNSLERNRENYLYELIENDDSYLFKVEDFVTGNLVDSNGDFIPYTIEVIAMDEDKITLQFTYVNRVHLD